MKTSLKFLSLSLLCLLPGCVCSPPTATSTGPSPGQLRARLELTPCATRAYTVVNNCGYLVRLHQDGTEIGSLELGGVLSVRNPPLWGRTVIVATGYDEHGRYTGAATWTFEHGSPEAWTIHRLYRPQEP